VLPPGTTPAEGASASSSAHRARMVETMRRRVTRRSCTRPAASNLGQMLNKLWASRIALACEHRRKPEHVDVLKKIGATYVCNSTRQLSWTT